jgi:purine nucleosidase
LPIPFLIDTDTASDDAVALIMALRTPTASVQAITVVSGNVGVDQATRNALYTAELCGSAVPVYSGAAQPLVRVAEHAQWYHGRDGLGDRGYPPPKRGPEKRHAVDAIIATAHATPGLVLVTLGPLTNVALAVARDPSWIANVSRCVVMGGAPCTEGNVTPAAEYNIWVDPEAARMVFRSGLPIEMVGWQLCRHEANLNAADIEHVRGIGTELAHFAIDCNRTAMAANLLQTREVGISLPDPTAMAIALDPALCLERSKHYVDIEIHGELTRGMTVVDRLNIVKDGRNRELWSEVTSRPPNCEVCWRLDVAGFKKMLCRALK